MPCKKWGGHGPPGPPGVAGPVSSVLEYVAKKESRLKFYRMSFALHSIDICIFFMLQTEPGRSRLYIFAGNICPSNHNSVVIVCRTIKKCLVFMSGFYLNKSIKPCLFTFFKTIGFNLIGRFKKVVGKLLLLS